MTEPASVNAAPVENGVATSLEEQPGTKVFAGNLAYTTTDEGLKTFFNPVADDIVSAQVIFRGTRSAGYGFVAFKTAEAAQKAVDLLNKTELDGRTLIVEVAKPTEEKREKKERRVPKKRVSKKPRSPAANGDAAITEATENKESGAANESADDAAKAKKKRNPRKAKKPRAAKEGEAATTGDNAVIAPPSDPKPKKARAPRAPREPKEPREPREPRERRPARPVGETPAGEPSKTMLFVANLGFSVDDAALSDLFTSAGITVVSARVVLRRWGGRRSKGYGFVDVGSEDEQKKALELLQGKEVGGREIAVKVAVNAQEKEAEAADVQSGAVPSLITA